MNNSIKSTAVSPRLWMFTALITAGFIFLFAFINERSQSPFINIVYCILVSLLGSLPALITLLIAVPLINMFKIKYADKLFILITLTILISILYGILAGILELRLFSLPNDIFSPFFTDMIAVTFILSISAVFSVGLNLKQLALYFTKGSQNPASYSEAFSIIFSKSHKTIHHGTRSFARSGFSTCTITPGTY